jgi:replicative DNA helicase
MARALKAHALRHGLGTIGASLINAAQDAEMDVLTAASEAMEKLAGLGQNAAMEPEGIGAVVAQVREYVEERAANPGEVWGIPYGLTRLDKFTGGAHPGQLVILAGEPGVGKSYLSDQMALSFGENSPGVIFSFEMTKIDTVLRMMGLMGLDTWRAHTGFVRAADREAMEKAARVIQERGIYIHDSRDGTLSLAGIRGKLARMKAKYGIRWFVLDYLRLIDEKAKDETEHSSRCSKELKNMCGALDLSGLVLVSVVKAGMDTGSTSKANIAGSGQQVHDADNIFFMTPHDTNPAIVNFTSKKGRHIANSSNKNMVLSKPANGLPFREMDTTRQEINA